MIMNVLKGKKMMKFEVVEDVERSDDNGGWIKVKVSENIDNVEWGEVERVVVLSFDFGDSLGGIEIDDDSDDRIEDLFSEECCKMLWEMEFVG